MGSHLVECDQLEGRAVRHHGATEQGRRATEEGDAWPWVRACQGGCILSHGVSPHRCHPAALLAQSTPFFYGFGLSGTHAPLAPPKRFVDKYAAAADELPLPPVHEPHGPLLARKDGFQSYVLTPAQQRGYTATYLAAAEYVDAQVGAILSLLQAFPAASARTAVVVHADHGFHLGEHGRWSKYTLYEESVRVPLIVRVPGGLRGVRSASIVELVDVLPTLLSLWGVGPSEQPPRLDGRSLVPLLTPRAGGAPHRASASVRTRDLR